MISNLQENIILSRLEDDLKNGSNLILTELSLFDIKSNLNPEKLKDKIVSAGKKKINDLNKLQKKHEKVLKDNNYNVEEFKSIIKKSYSKHTPKIIEGIKTLDKKLITTSITNSAIEIKNNLKKRDLFDFNKDTPTNVLISIGMVYIILIINTLFMAVVANIFGPIVGMLFLAIVCAPIVEEFGKYLAIKANIGPEFLLTFNIAEFSLYYVRMAAVGIPAATIFIIRLLPVLMHYATAWIQTEYQSKGKDGIGYIIGVLMHAIWNAMATFRLILEAVK